MSEPSTVSAHQIFFFLTSSLHCIKDFRSFLLFQVFSKIICAALIESMLQLERTKQEIRFQRFKHEVGKDWYAGNFSPLFVGEQQLVANLPLSLDVI